jgi:hypothetical protein
LIRGILLCLINILIKQGNEKKMFPASIQRGRTPSK